VRAKISATLTGRTLPTKHVANIQAGSKKKIVYCYDHCTREYVTEFNGLREMTRQLDLCGDVMIRRKIKSGDPLVGTYKGSSYS
jgi:hypothetical protein